MEDEAKIILIVILSLVFIGMCGIGYNLIGNNLKYQCISELSKNNQIELAKEVCK